MTKKQHHLLMEHHGGWQKPVRRALLLVTVTVAAMVLAAPEVRSSEKSFAPLKSLNNSVKLTSPGNSPPCVPPQASRMDTRSDTQKAAARVQRNAGDPSLSYAMVLSMALGLRSVAGPVENTRVPVANKTESHGLSAGASLDRPNRYALSGGRSEQCPGRVSMK